MPRLDQVDAQCDTTLALVPLPELADENLRGYVMLLSAHFQGFCRDLHTECVQIIAGAAPPTMRLMIQTQSVARRGLDGANPNFSTIQSDFDRFGLNIQAALVADAANQPRITHLGHLNLWRNFA